MGEIIQDDVVFSANTFSVTTPLAAFASESLLPMDYIIRLKQDPPPMTCLIHAIILSDDKLVIAKSSIANLRQSSIPVQEFKQQFLKQDVTVPSTINHVHILSFNAKTTNMEFVSIHDNNLYLVLKTDALDLIKDIVNQIISKELLIKSQINTFLSDILNQNISFSTTQAPVVKPDNPIVSNVNSVVKRSNSMKTSHQSRKTYLRIRRDIWDIFSGYSLQNSVETANENYKKTNSNFAKIRLVEKALIERQKMIADNENKQSAQLRVMHQTLIFTEMQGLSTRYFNNLVGRLQFSLEKIGNDPVFSMIMRLATEHEYCTGLICYSNPIFSIDKGMLILKLLKYKYELKPMFIISCMPDKQNYISIYHGSQATLTNDTLSFNQELPSLTIMQLKNTTAVSFKMRSIKNSDLIDSNILPIYHQDKIAFLCVKKATTIVVNSKPMICNEFTLQFQNIPKQLVHNNKSVIIRSREHTFITNIDLKSKDIFVENYKLQSIDVDHWTKISNTFRQMEPIHYAFGTVVFLIILVMSCFFIVICYIRVPSILSALTCNLCCKDKLLTRKQYLLNKKRLETHDRTRVKFSELKVTDDEQSPTSQP